MNHYARDGFAVVAGGFEAREIASWSSECERLASLLPGLASRARVVASPDRADRLDPVLDLSPVFTTLAGDERVVGAAADAIGGPATLLKDKLILKPPHAGGYLPHQDFAYWQWLDVPADDLVTVAVCIDGGGGDSGAVRAVAAAHDRLRSPAGIVGDVDPGWYAEQTVVDLSTSAGDLLLLHPLAPHDSGTNTTDRPRRMLFLTFVRASHGLRREDYYGSIGPLLEEAEAPDRRTISR